MKDELKQLRLKENYTDIMELFSDTTKAALFAFFGFSATFMVGGFGIAFFHIFS